MSFRYNKLDYMHKISLNITSFIIIYLYNAYIIGEMIFGYLNKYKMICVIYSDESKHI